MQSFKDFVTEDIESAVKTGLDKYKTRKLSGQYDVSHTGDGNVKFTHKKKSPGAPSYHSSHVTNALVKNGLRVKNVEHHEDGFTMKVSR